MLCGICNTDMVGMTHEFDRIFCKRKCKDKARSIEMGALYKEWRGAGLAIASTSPERALLMQAPLGAAHYQLTHYAANGSIKRFPESGGWRLRLFEVPKVRVPGLYSVIFTDANQLNPICVGTVPIGMIYAKKKRK
jgi:hypothetical protein